MSLSHTNSASTVRAAAFVATQNRIDVKSKVKCNPPNRVCGERCIPPNWKCRIKGEGTDNASRVVAGDPLAGAASIARGRRRLAKGLRKGKIEEIQAGRAAIARGIVKSVPGKNIKQKQQLRQTVEKVVLPVATTLFGIWALRQGHEAAKVLFPAYAQGPGKAIEESAGTAVGFVLDRIPIYGDQRRLQRKVASLRANTLARAVVISANESPNSLSYKSTVFSNLSRSTNAASAEINKNLVAKSTSTAADETSTTEIKPYDAWRADLLSNTLGATKSYGRPGSGERVSSYSEVATNRLLSRQFNIDPNTLIGSNNEERKSFLTNQIAEKLSKARDEMRADMAVRGLSYKNTEHVGRYIDIVETKTNSVFGKAREGKEQEAKAEFRGLIRDVVLGGEQSNPSSIAKTMYQKTFDGYNNYFASAAERIREDLSPENRRKFMADSPLRDTLIGVAERVKSKVRITAPIAGANHAELVLQRVYNEYSITGKSTRGSNSWTTSDNDIRYAAQDLGWDGQGGAEAAFGFIKRTGQFPRLERRVTESTTSNQTTSAPTTTATSTTRGRARRATRTAPTLAQRVATYEKAGYSPERAREKALEDEQKAKQRKNNTKKSDSMDDIPTRLKAYLEVKSRLDKRCGKSGIPDNKKCTKPTGATSKKSSDEGFYKTLVASSVLVGGVAVTATLASSIDDVVKTRSRQFATPSISTFRQQFGDPQKFRSAITEDLSKGAFGKTYISKVDGKTYVVKTPTQGSKEKRAAMGIGLNSEARRNLYRSQGRITSNEVMNGVIAGDIGVGPKVVAADKNTLVTTMVAGSPMKRVDRKSKRKLHNTLAKLHRAGIAHNDLKPDNMFQDNSGNIKLIDYGLSARSPSAVAKEWYTAMNKSSSNPLVGVTQTTIGAFELRTVNQLGYAKAERALSRVIGGSITLEAIEKAGTDSRKSRQMQLIINNYYAGKYNRGPQ